MPLLMNFIRMAPTLEKEPSNYMQTLTRYLSNIMNSVLLGLPTEIKELIYFDALSHAATMMLVSLKLFFSGSIGGADLDGSPYLWIPKSEESIQMVLLRLPKMSAT